MGRAAVCASASRPAAPKLDEGARWQRPRSADILKRSSSSHIPSSCMRSCFTLDLEKDFLFEAQTSVSPQGAGRGRGGLT